MKRIISSQNNRKVGGVDSRGQRKGPLCPSEDKGSSPAVAKLFKFHIICVK